MLTIYTSIYEITMSLVIFMFYFIQVTWVFIMVQTWWNNIFGKELKNFTKTTLSLSV